MLWRRRDTKAKASGKAKKREKTNENGGAGHDSTVSISFGFKVRHRLEVKSELKPALVRHVHIFNRLMAYYKIDFLSIEYWLSVWARV